MSSHQNRVKFFVAVAKATVFALCVRMLDLGPQLARADGESESDVRVGVKQSWKLVNEVLLPRLSGTYSVVLDYKPGDPAQTIPRKDLGSYEFSLVDSQMKVINRREGVERVGVVNQEYWFEIGRKDATGRYQINYLAPQQGAGARQTELKEEYRAERFNEILSAWYLFGDPVAVVIERPEFAIQKIQRTSEGFVRVDFTYAVPGKSPPILAAQLGSHVVLDPARHWCVVTYEAQRNWGVERGDYEYDGALEGYPKLLRMVQTSSNKGDVEPKGMVATKTVTFSRLERSDATAANGGFRLTDYGFQEPTFAPRRSYVYAWYFLIALGCLACGIWISRRRKQLR